MSHSKVTGRFRADTPQAVLLRVPVDNGEQGFTDDVWFPRSQIKHIRKEPTGPAKLNYNYTITVADWLVERNKVIIDEMLPEDYYEARSSSPLDLPDGLREKSWEDRYYEALAQCTERYEEMAPPESAACNLLRQLSVGVEDRMPLVKLNRWLGYIQGRLIGEGHTSVKAERDWTRPLFEPLDKGDDSPLKPEE